MSLNDGICQLSVNPPSVKALPPHLAKSRWLASRTRLQLRSRSRRHPQLVQRHTEGMLPTARDTDLPSAKPCRPSEPEPARQW